jgi:hypothetical protein
MVRAHSIAPLKSGLRQLAGSRTGDGTSSPLEKLVPLHEDLWRAWSPGQT